MAKCIMIQGTMSGAGKSLLTAGLCRVFAQDGYRVAPFKSQNMALNSYITKDGSEIGRAQAVQAMACGIEPDARMNPVLLKPTTDMGSQVIVMGKVSDQLSAKEYYAKKRELIPTVKAAYDSLADDYDIIVIEGAGSPAEINLMKDDFVNMGLAKLVDAPVLLVGDIDRGGVFAQLFGTVSLLDREDADRIAGLIVNKFRGDVEILKPGIAQLEQICKKKVLGVVPYTAADIEEEDSISDRLSNRKVTEKEKAIRIGVLRLPRISNYTDFQPLETEEDVELSYVTKREDLKDLDLILIPGTKSTMEDLKWMRQSGLEGAVLRAASQGTPVMGICGGFQMLGAKILDPAGSEGAKGEGIRGMQLLPIETVFSEEKIQKQVQHVVPEVSGMWDMLSGLCVSGYEIHMGRSLLDGADANVIVCCDNVIGTYLHGIFEDGTFRGAFLECLAKKKGIRRGEDTQIDYSEYRARQFDILAEDIRKSVDLDAVYAIMGLKKAESNQTVQKQDGVDCGQITYVKPTEIESRSMAIIDSVLKESNADISRFSESEIPVLKRAIHTSADFDYVENLIFSNDAVECMMQLIKEGCDIVTDTQMAKSGINKTELAKYGGSVHCFMSDEDVAKEAKERSVTRAVVSMERAMQSEKPVIFAIGNAPTALISLHRLLAQHPSVIRGIIAVPVGFVNVVEAKELILSDPVCSIVARGRKGGSNVAAAIVNALLYELREKATSI